MVDGTAVEEMHHAPAPHLNPGPLLQLGNGFMASRIFLSAIEVDLFTHLHRANGALSCRDVCEQLKLHPRAFPDFLDALVSFGALHRSGIGDNALYSNSEVTDAFFVKDRKTFLGGFLEMHSTRTYAFWNHFTEALKTGMSQNEAHVRNTGQPMWEAMYEDEHSLKTFVNAMKGLGKQGHAEFGRLLAAGELEEEGKIRGEGEVLTVLDIGGASGQLCCEVAMADELAKCVTMDLEKVGVFARENVRDHGLEDRVVVVDGDMWTDDFNKWCDADVIVMGMLLHDYGLKGRKMLIKKAYDALKEGGRLVTIEMFIDEGRRESEGVVMSMLMLIETEQGNNFTAGEFGEWAQEAGFRAWREVHLHGPVGAVVAFK